MERPILKNKIFLYLTEFFSGMSVMAVELGASRLLAPYFSSSQIVWTIIIGTIMIAMALGNIYGGKAADKNPNPDKLYGRILVASIWIALIPVLGKYIILGISGLLILTVSTNFLIIAAFAACMIIFVFPLFLLGTVTPCLVKYSVDSLNENGKTVGYLNASNTMPAKNNMNLGLAACFQTNTLFRNRHIRVYYVVCAPSISLKTRRNTCKQPKRRYFR